MKVRLKALTQLLTVVCLSAAAVGCGDDLGTPVVAADVQNSGDSPPTSNNTDSNNTDANSTTPDTPVDPSANVETCEPATECPATACGSVDDGCGGTIECTVGCECLDGEVQIESCGTCGLGQTSCADGATGDGDCAMPPIPEALVIEPAECATRVHHVSTSASQSGDGSADSPYQSLNAAIQAASDDDIILYSSPMPTPGERITIDRRVHIIGGYTTSFAYQPTSRSLIRVATPSTGIIPGSTPTIGLEIADVQGQVVLAHLDIETADASLTTDSEAASSNVAIWAHDAEEVRLVDTKVRAGDATAPPSRNFVATPGSNGAAGGNAPTDGSPGAAGLNPRCLAADGGSGGWGGELGSQPTRGTFSSGGGAAGSPGNSTVPGGFDGGIGDRGADGAKGAHGVFASQILMDFWAPAASANGRSGDAGQAGGGGGGGGGALHEYTGDGTYKKGTGGGGGGAGGCGGQPGLGGKAGGASIALLTVNSNVTADATSELFAGRGGDGEDGFHGAAGGSGGRGGYGTSSTIYHPTGTSTTLPWTSADGGRGADGGAGGPGGGGAGGPSFVVFCSEGTYSGEAGSERTVGSGGDGGNAPQSTNYPAPDGPTKLSEGCD